jgi:hypothetical protein
LLVIRTFVKKKNRFTIIMFARGRPARALTFSHKVSPMDITDDYAGSFVTGSGTIGTTPTQISAASRKLTRGVEVRADFANTGMIYVGNSSTVTANSAAATDGYPIASNEKTFIPIDDLSKIWLIASGAGQNYFWKAA